MLLLSESLHPCLSAALWCWSASRLKGDNETSEVSIHIFFYRLDPLLFWVTAFWRCKTHRDRWFIGENINSCHDKLIRKKVQTRLCAFLRLILLCLQFFDTLIKQCCTTFAPKIRFEQNDSIPPPYQFKRGDVRLNLHYESTDWNEAF